MPPVGFEPTISAGERPQTYVLDRAATGTGIVYQYIRLNGGPDSSVGIATRYELEGPGIESRWGRDSLHPFRPAVGPTQPTNQWVPHLSRE